MLHKYAASFDAEPSKWGFLTGSKDSIYSLARTGFLVDVMQDTANAGNIIHSPMFILVDPKKRIRGYYDSNSKEQVNKLIDEVKVQIAEQLRQVTDR